MRSAAARIALSVRSASCHLLALFTREFQSESAGDPLGNRVLDAEDVRELFVKLTRPQLRLVSNAHEAGGDSDAVGRVVNVTIQHGLHS